MSAYIVEKEHIIYMVKAWQLDEMKYSSHGPSDIQLAEICTMLWQENVRSVNYRYSRRNKLSDYVVTGEEYASLQWDCIEWPQVMQSVSCYQYQSCEHKGWRKSKAYQWTEDLYHIAARHVLEGQNLGLLWGAPNPQ